MRLAVCSEQLLVEKYDSPTPLSVAIIDSVMQRRVKNRVSIVMDTGNLDSYLIDKQQYDEH